MARKTTLDIPPENAEKAKSVQEQIDLANTIFPEDVKPAEIGNQALKLLLVEAQGFIKLDSELKKFWTKCADKYTPDAPKAIEVVSKQSPEEMLEKSFEKHDILLAEAEAFAKNYGELADERGLEVDALERTLDEQFRPQSEHDKELTDAAYQRTVITESQDNS